MIDKFFAFLGTVMVVTAVGIALRPGAPTAGVVKAVGDSVANIQRATHA
jgi:hypothetical protein